MAKKIVNLPAGKAGKTAKVSKKSVKKRDHVSWL